MADNQPDSHYRIFRKQLENEIAKYNCDGDDRTAVQRQKQQLTHLIGLENEFRRTLIKHPWGAGVYRDFVKFITEEKRNILAARPYFRERQTVFTARISVELKKGNDRGLYPFQFNFLFIQFVMDCRKWSEKSKLARLYREIAKVREELVVLNAPLAVSRSRLFYKKTPESHLQYMDCLEIAAEGLLVAIDKFCIPPPKEDQSDVTDKMGWARFRHMAIGRMVGFLIERYSDTMVHFYPSDERKIYRGNKVVHLLEQEIGGVDYDRLAKAVNKGARADQKTTANEIADLMMAASTVSADEQTSPVEGEGETFIDRYASPADEQPDNLAEQHEALCVMRTAMTQLSTFELKYLRLRGIEVNPR